jgi:pyocin large subunit-like protein
MTNGTTILFIQVLTTHSLMKGYMRVGLAVDIQFKRAIMKEKFVLRRVNTGEDILIDGTRKMIEWLWVTIITMHQVF